MPTQIRLLGVHGKNAPTKKSKTVEASAFNIAGVIGQFERKYAKAFPVQNPTEQATIFGQQVNSAWYAPDIMKTLWDNLAGSPAKVYIKAHVGYTGSAIDAVVASAELDDRAGSPLKTLKLQSAYQEELDYGISGNRTGYAIVGGNRYSTTLADTVATSATSAVLTSVIGVKVGDIVAFVVTGGTVYKKITNINESTNTVEWSGTFHATYTGAIADAVHVKGFKIKTYRKSITGIVSEVQTELGNSWCTMESEVTEYYAPNVHRYNEWLKVTDLASASTLYEAFPADVSTVAYLASGADGTAPTTSAHWSADLTAFDSLPIRMLTNPETADVTIQKAIETYCKNRTDTPIAITTLAENQTKAQLLVIGSGYQRSDDVFQVNVADWLNVTDPFNSAPSAPDRAIPPVGAVIGAWIRTIATLGIHYIPAVDSITLLGINGIDNSNLATISEQDRTDIASYGINIIQFVDGSGYRIRNFFTPSTDTAVLFANGVIMRNFIKLSSEDSLRSSENTPNSFNRIREDREAIRMFLYGLWFRGSNGSTPEGEFYGQQENSDGSLTAPEDHFEVIADAVNNPQSRINLGERNIDVHFTYPTPAGSIEIRVGILLR